MAGWTPVFHDWRLLLQGRNVHYWRDPVRDLSWPGLNIDTEVIRGVNDDELVARIETGRGGEGGVGVIEYVEWGAPTAGAACSTVLNQVRTVSGSSGAFMATS